jgi:hypothetical protein
MADRGKRDLVVGQLRPEIAWNVARHDSAAFDVMSIVSTCLNYRGGLAELLEVVRFGERGSDAWKNLEAAAGRFLSGG